MPLQLSQKVEILSRILREGGLTVETEWPARRGSSTYKLEVYVPELHVAFDLRGRSKKRHFQTAMDDLGIVILTAEGSEEKNWHDEETLRIATRLALRRVLNDSASAATRKKLAARW